MVNIDEVIKILPKSIWDIINQKKIDNLQEIRIKVNKPLILQIGNIETIEEYLPTKKDLESIIKKISNYSLYAFENEIRQGFITIKGGHRIGICGDCVLENNAIKTIKNIASLNIRICREVLGCSDKIMNFIIENNRLKNTIIISPPKCGKTTIIRDIARNLSDGMTKFNFKGKKVSVIDERSEIASCYEGVPQMNIGIRTDVLNSCPKSEGIMMSIRSMSPDIIICDELGTQKEIESILMALNCGIGLVASIHGYDISDLQRRIIFKDVVDNKVFDIALVLSNIHGPGTLEKVYNFANNKLIWSRKYD